MITEKKKWLIIVIETVVRDLDSNLLIAIKALKSDWNVIFVHQSRLINIVNRLPRGVFLDKGAGESHAKKFKQLKEMGFTLVSNDAEGLLILDESEYLANRVSERSLDFLDSYFTWGRNHYNVVSKNYPEYSDKLRIIGDPRIDLLHPFYSSIYTEEINMIKTEFPNLVLFVGSFSLEDPRSYNYDLQNENGRIRLLNDIRKYNTSRVRRESFLRIVQNFATKNPTKKIIYRPHPSEGLIGLKRRFYNYNNVTVTMFHSVQALVRSASTIIHTGSTISIESYISGHKTLLFIPSEDNDNNNIHEIVKKSSIIVSSVEDIETYLNNGIPTTEITMDILKEYINYEDFANTRIINELNELNIIKDSLDLKAVPLYSRTILHAKWLIKVIYHTYIKKNPYLNKYYKFDIPQIIKKINSIKKIEKLTGDISLNQIDRDSFALIYNLKK